MCTGLVSALLRIPVRRDVAMTGEITLRGRVLAIGGLKEKILAAHRAGIRTVILPKENVKDLQDIPKRILKALRLVPVAHMDEVLRVALALNQKESADFLKEPSVAVDWRVPVERRGGNGGGGNGDRRESIPVASAIPPPETPTKEVPSQPPALETTVVPIVPEGVPEGSSGGGRGER
jgi:hypothetical protein